MSILKKNFKPFSNQPQPKVAMMICIHNEERFLDAHLRYHRALGVSRAYVFLDRCDDASLLIAQSLPWVVPIIVDDRLHAISPFYTDLFRICADYALRMARSEGFEWLVSFDVDEFIFANNLSTVRDKDFDLTNMPLDEILRIGHLPTLLATMSPKTEAVFTASWNVIPGQLEPNAPFWKQQFFQDRMPLPRTMCDPLTGHTLVWPGRLASRGKSIARTNADIQCHGSHEWVRSQIVSDLKRPTRIPIATENHGFLYHFYVTDSRHWREKYQKLSRELTLWHAGHPVGFPKQCGKRASAVLNDEEIELFLNEWVYTPLKELNSYVRQGLIRKSDMVEKVLTGFNFDRLKDSPPNHAHIDSVLGQFRETERRVIAGISGKKVKSPLNIKSTPRQNKKQAGTLPPISCICIPQGKPERLEEAIYSFLQQDYPGEKELLILNNNLDYCLEFDHPEVSIINLTEPFFQPSQRYNTAVALCNHDLIFLWDADGIYLPHCISFTIEKFGKNKGYFKADKAFVLSDNKLRLPRQNIFHSGSCFTRKAFDRTRGYTFGEKLHFYREEIEAHLERKHPKLVQYCDIAIEDIFYIYKWDGVKTFQDKGSALSIETQPGHIKLNPHWETDYRILVRNFGNDTSPVIHPQFEAETHNTRSLTNEVSSS